MQTRVMLQRILPSLQNSFFHHTRNFSMPSAAIVQQFKKLNSQGLLFLKTRNFEEAQALFTQAFDFAQQQENQLMANLALCNLGTALSKQKKFIEAKEALQKSLAFLSRSEEVTPDILVSSNMTLANVHSELGDVENALKSYDHAASILEQLTSSQSSERGEKTDTSLITQLASLKYQKALTLHKNGNTEAESCYQNALDLLKRAGADSEVSYAQVLSSYAALLSNDENRLSDAINTMKAAMLIFGQHKDPRYADTLESYAGLITRALGIDTQQQEQQQEQQEEVEEQQQEAEQNNKTKKQ